MVWFQCEDCGEDLKKPKLPNHFRICSATGFSCIDCGQTFSQQSVQGHTQCITEAEKYGPKGQGKVSNGTSAKPNKDSKQLPYFDIKVGLSKRPPWFCSLCNTKATSEQTLLLHADGKKHRAKARAFHASKQPAQQNQEAALPTKLPPEDTSVGQSIDSKDVDKSGGAANNLGADGGNLPSNKKRKYDESEKVDAKKKAFHDTPNGVGDGEVVQAERTEVESERASKAAAREGKRKNANQLNEDTACKIKWKKLIKSTLKSNPAGKLKMKKLRKLMVKAFKESGIVEDENQLGETLEHKINSSSQFAIDGKYVCLVAKEHNVR